VQLDVHFDGTKLDAEGGKWIALIDVLRAGTSIAFSLMNGARAVMPVETSEEALRLVDHLTRDDVILCGERNGLPIPGFEIGNSPHAFTAELVRGKTVIMATSSGIGDLIRSGSGNRLVVPSLVNLAAAATFLAPRAAECGLSMVCPFNQGRLALEDLLCAGLLIEYIEGKTGRQGTGNDGFLVAKSIAATYGTNVLGSLQRSDQGQQLIEQGLQEDIRHCARLSTMEVIPVASDGQLVSAKESQR